CGCSGACSAPDGCRKLVALPRERTSGAPTGPRIASLMSQARLAEEELSALGPVLHWETPMYEMVIYGVSFDLVGKQPIVLLKTADGNKFLPIWIGHPEAAAILMKLQGASTPRPMTHDLLTDMLSQLDAHVVRICVTELRDNTFYASITLSTD